MELNIQSVLNLDLEDNFYDQTIQNYQSKVQEELSTLNRMLNLQNTIKNSINVQQIGKLDQYEEILEEREIILKGLEILKNQQSIQEQFIDQQYSDSQLEQQEQINQQTVILKSLNKDLDDYFSIMGRIGKMYKRMQDSKEAL